MKRDNDFIREMLFEIERDNGPYFMAVEYLNMDEKDQKRFYHAKLLSDAGFLCEVNDGVFRMTNSGHDYLDAIRSDTVWEKTKSSAASVGGVTLGIMRDIAVAYLKREASEKLGISLQP